MPMTRTDNELYLAHRGINVYRVYENDDPDLPYNFWFSLHADCGGDDDDPHFDVNALEMKLQRLNLLPEELVVGEHNGQETADDDERQTIIRLALDHGLIDLPEGVELDRFSKQLAAKAYVQNGFARCPYPGCGGQDIDTGSIDIDGNTASQECTCNICGRSYTDIYRLADVRFDDPIH